MIYLNDTTVTDDTDANFEIKGSLTITAPNNGEGWEQGGPAQNITWTKTGTLGNVELRYSTDGGTTYPNLITGSVSSTSPYPWTIPTAASGRPARGRSGGSERRKPRRTSSPSSRTTRRKCGRRRR